MKKFIYLFAMLLVGLVACNNVADQKCAAECAKECCVAVEGANENVGCQVEGGTCLADHSCCTAKVEVAPCCCGDAECAGECHAKAEAAPCCCGDAECAGECHADAEESHEGHDHN